MSYSTKTCLYIFTLVIFWSCSKSKTDNPLPEETITIGFVSPSPSSNLSYNKAHDLEVSATGDVKSVAFYLDGRSIGNVSARPYRISWTAKDLDPGSHTIKAIAISAHGREFKREIEIGLKLALGDHFRGGIVFELDSIGNHGLIAAEKDLADEKGQPQNYVWGSEGTTGTSFDDGIGNTRKLAAQATNPDQMGHRFKGTGLNMNGFADWYIPSFFELGTLRKNADLVGGLSKDNNAIYWSSTERNAQQAFYLNFGPATEIYDFKKTRGRVRPVRKF